MPKFVCDLKEEWRAAVVELGRGGGLTGQVYAHMVTKHAVAAVQKFYADWQDDPARIHCTAEALQACKAFSACIPHDV